MGRQTVSLSPAFFCEGRLQMSDPVFQVTTTVHDMAGIELCGGESRHHELLRMATTMNYMAHPAYRLSTAAGAFLQGQSDDAGHQWTLVEFWHKDYEPFVAWLNEQASKETVS
jgi:hypothetical protein